MGTVTRASESARWARYCEDLDRATTSVCAHRAMSTVVISTGFTPQQNAEIKSLVRTLDLTFEEQYVGGAHFDVLLAATTRSVKYDQARQMRKPIVTFEWLVASSGARRLVAMDRYKTPPFSRLHRVDHGLHGLRRENAVTELGGRERGEILARLGTGQVHAPDRGETRGR